jgi:tRNA pseudouridine55 synthase
MDGVLNIHKPPRLTSHDVVQRVRGVLGEKRIGHTGTLDPLATGVLVLCVGRATRIAQYLEAGEKEYQAVMRLGITTDTLDADGRVLETRSYAPPDRETIIQAAQRFTGSIMQQPPVYSAIKVAGVPSYRRAREGTAVTLSPRPVNIYHIGVTAYSDPFVSLTVRCSKGVYIRTLCADIGEALGMGAHMTSLVRTRSGRFAIEQSVSLDQLQELAASQSREQALIPLSEALGDMPMVPISAAESARVKHGNQVPWSGAPENDGRLVRLHDDGGKLLALARVADGFFKPELVFS